MTDNALELRIEGLAETVRGLRKTEKTLGRSVSKALRVFAKELRTKAEARGASLGATHAGAVRRRAISHFARGDSAGLKLLASKVAFALGAEFGSHQFGQFPAWRGNRWTDPAGSNVGYMIHPAMRAYLPEATDRIADAIVEQIGEDIGAM